MQYHLLKADIWCSPKKSSNASLAHSRYAWQNKRHRRWHLFFLDHQRRTRLRQRVVLSGSSAWNNLTKTSDRKSCLTNIIQITFSGASQALVDTVVAMNLNSTLFCFVVAIILLIFGTFMEGTAIAVLLVPVLWPIAQSMGIDGRHCKGRDPIPDRICCSILPVRILKRFLHNAYLINLGN